MLFLDLKFKHAIILTFGALQEFIANEGDGEPPLEGSIPDMTSLTELVSDVLIFLLRTFIAVCPCRLVIRIHDVVSIIFQVLY